MFEAGEIGHGTAIRADFQEKGHGQMGEIWNGNAEENIFMSLVLELQIPAEKQFLLNMAVSLALLRTVQEFLPEAKIKWPNDIYYRQQKLAGILIENSLQGNMLCGSIIGVGVNILQKDFGSINKAASICSFLKYDLDVHEVYTKLIQQLEWQLNTLGDEWRIWKEYHENLLFCGEITSFEHKGRIFKAKVLGVDEWGRLKLEEGTQIHPYSIKEIRWINL